MTKMWTLCVLLSAVMLAALGCDDDEGGSLSSGINSSKQLDELTEAEELKMCEEYASEVNSLFTKEKICKLIAVELGKSMGNNTQMCESTYDSCMSDQMQEVFNQLLDDLKIDCSADDYDDGYDDGEEAECNATVGEAEKCANDLIAAAKAALNEISCDNLTSFEEPEEPASCEIVDQKCPGYM